MTKYLFSLVVIYADDQSLKPDAVADEIQGKSSDINAGFGGKYVWLCPEWTVVREEAITELSVERSSTPVRNYNDLAMGAKGDYRYIRGSHDGLDGVTKVGLFRFDKELSPEEIRERIGQSGFSHYSEDINKGRGGEYLYLIWAY